MPWYTHLLVKFFDYLLCDGSHGFSKYGWKFIPLCILVSCGKTLPIASVFGLEEDSQSLNALLVSVHCDKPSCECTLHKPSRTSYVLTATTTVWIAIHSNCGMKQKQASVHFGNLFLTANSESLGQLNRSHIQGKDLRRNRSLDKKKLSDLPLSSRI